jgi:hypothetical protein
LNNTDSKKYIDDKIGNVIFDYPKLIYDVNQVKTENEEILRGLLVILYVIQKIYYEVGKNIENTTNTLIYNALQEGKFSFLINPVHDSDILFYRLASESDTNIIVLPANLTKSCSDKNTNSVALITGLYSLYKLLEKCLNITTHTSRCFRMYKEIALCYSDYTPTKNEQFIIDYCVNYIV